MIEQSSALGIEDNDSNSILGKIVTDIGQLVTAANEGSVPTIVEVSSAQILAMGTTPIELLAAPGAGKYFDIDKVIIEYLHNGTAYTVPSSPTFYLDGAFDAYIDKIILTSASNSVATVNANSRNTITVGSGSGSVKIVYNRDILNSNLIMGTTNGDNPTLGNGTIRVKIYSKTVTFNA